MIGRKGRRQSFEKEALPQLDALYAMALRLTRNPPDAEDLVQDSLVKAYRFFHRYQEGTNIKAWLFKVLVNLYYNSRRKVKKDHRLQLEALTSQSGSPVISEASSAAQNLESILLDHLSEGHIRQALESLPEEFRLAVVLCDLYDFSYKEIADILDCPVGTVMSRLYRGRRLLQRRLFEYALEQGYIHPTDGAADPAQEVQDDLAAYRLRRKCRDSEREP